MKTKEPLGWHLKLYALFFDEPWGHMIGWICDDGRKAQAF